MAVKRNQNCGVGEYEPAAPPNKTCCQCGGPWSLPLPVVNKDMHFRYQDQPFLPHAQGSGICWTCFDKMNPNGSFNR